MNMFNRHSDRLSKSTKGKDSSSGLGVALTLIPIGVANAHKHTCSGQTSHPHEMLHKDDICEMPKQMTIFYGGRVIVFENVLSHKAKELMSLASCFASSPVCHTSSLEEVSKLPDAFFRDLSQTRTRSLSRFFEKRKDRIKARAPYTLSANSNKTVEPDHKSWLQLAAGNQ